MPFTGKSAYLCSNKSYACGIGGGGEANPFFFFNLNRLFKNWKNLPQRVSLFGNRTALG